VLLMVSALREVLGLGTLLGAPVLDRALFPMAQLPSGGFMVVALLMCVWRAAVSSVKKQMSLEEEQQ
jgi:electron transport complex protein RnfE